MIILDVSTPLMPGATDVRGNAQHWFIRTAEAANETTFLNWQGKFSTPEEWDSLDAIPANNAYIPAVNPGFHSRRGLSAETITTKHLLAFRGAYFKALENWQHAFREEGDAFFEVLQRKTQHFEDGTRDYLSYMGLRIRDWLGSIAIHIMLLCNNRDAWNFLRNRRDIIVLNFPDHPIIPENLRVFFNQDMMSVLARDLFLSMPRPNTEDINARLDTFLAAYISSDYAPPPFSYCRLQYDHGVLVMRSHVESLFTVKPPEVRSWHVPFLQPPAVNTFVVLVPDLFAYVTPGDLPIDSMILRPLAYTSNLDALEVWLQRTDAVGLMQRLDIPIPGLALITRPPDGVQVQIAFVERTFHGIPLAASLEGTFSVLDSAGQESNIGTWLIRGSAPTMENVIPGAISNSGTSYPALVVGDLFAFAHATDVPLASVTVSLGEHLFNFYGFGILLHRSDAGVADINLSAHFNEPQVLVVPPLGVTWQVLITGVGGLGIGNPVLWAGSIWCTDTDGVESNHALISITLAQ